MPVRRWLFTINIVEEAAGYFFLFKVFQDTEITALVMIDWMAWALVVCASAVFFRISHQGILVHHDSHDRFFIHLSPSFF